MAYIQGHSLAEFVNPNKPQNERHIATVVRKLAVALNEAHNNGLIHRDVKPANVMIDHRNEPIIMDFGLARQMDDEVDAKLTRDGAILGSPAYMSPEQIEGIPDKIGPACDIYSLGRHFVRIADRPTALSRNCRFDHRPDPVEGTRASLRRFDRISIRGWRTSV